MPRPNFPHTIFEFEQWFPDEEACVKFLIASRWPDGFMCPRCAGKEYFWLPKRTLLQCKKCGYQASPTSGTVMHRTKQPLKYWFHAAYLVTTLTPGMSALQFQRQVGISNYETAFTMLHKLRSAMVRQGRDKLSALVEADETYIGGPEPGKPGRGAAGKVIVAGAVDLRGKNANRVRLMVVPDVTQETLTGFIEGNVEQGAAVTQPSIRQILAANEVQVVPNQRADPTGISASCSSRHPPGHSSHRLVAGLPGRMAEVGDHP